ncbi:hypothetical protein TthSNM11_03810 [Thermus thermophilus]|nr:hypothetical protein TthSNM11_03810 [Thermus thermophilus]BDG20726.1 hypothetical protein TthSNM17_03880 [Thermus thermophilus]
MGEGGEVGLEGGLGGQVAFGEVLALQKEKLDKETPESYAFHPPVVKGLPTPTCVRFTPDLEGLLVCSPTNGVIWEVRGAIV